VINEAGQVTAQLPPFTQGVLEATVQGRRGLTPFARWGNVPALMLALLMLAFTAWHGLRRPRLR
jgi:apolipoprotein N-acyltransferase